MSEEKLLEKIFTKEDIRNIKVTREHFEKWINTKNDKSSYISYIKHETVLWKKVKTNIPKQKLHKPFVRRIIRLHTMALTHYKDDLDLWLSYIKFCMQAEHTLLSNAFAQMLSHHTDKKLWLLAAKWELDECRNVKKALNYLNRGLCYHPRASSLYCEIFKIKLQTPTLLISSINVKNKQEESEIEATNLYHSILKEIPDDIDLYINLLIVAIKHPYATTLQNEIAKNLILHFPRSEDVWYNLAKRELEGHHLTKDGKYKFIASSLPQVRLTNLVKKFQYAVCQIQTGTMWSKYLDTLLDLYEDKNYNEQFMKETFSRACEEAHAANLLSEEHYMKWFEHLQSSPDLPRILEEATKNNPLYLQVWITRIRYHIANGDEKQIESVFDEAIKILGDNSIQIWRMKLQYYQLNLNNKDTLKLEAIYREGIMFSPTVAKLLKPQFLDWVMLFKLDKAREEYKVLAEQEPLCMEIHKKMAELEAMCSQPDEENLKLISELATKQFGENVWLEYVNEEILRGPRWKKKLFTKYFLPPT